MTEISASAAPVSYSTAFGAYDTVHVVRLWKEPTGWKAAPQGMCGARLLVVSGALQFAPAAVSEANCLRCLREVRGLRITSRSADGLVTPGWR